MRIACQTLLHGEDELNLERAAPRKPHSDPQSDMMATTSALLIKRITLGACTQPNRTRDWHDSLRGSRRSENARMRYVEMDESVDDRRYGRRIQVLSFASVSRGTAATSRIIFCISSPPSGESSRLLFCISAR